MMAINTGATPPPPDHVILVHGTGAGDDAIRGAKWWQLGSEFETSLRRRLGAHTGSVQAVVMEPFQWDGDNSERARMAAAAKLLARLRTLESVSASYHLVGHSHGGSIIWQALTQSARSPRPLAGLRSWTTVGTPFLNFRAVAPDIWALTSLLVLSAILTFIFFSFGDVQDWWPHARQYFRTVTGLDFNAGFDADILADVKWSGLLLVLLSFAAFVIIWVMPFVRVATAAARLFLLDGFDVIAQRRAATLYGDKWLGLWHPQDEPINGLAGTLGDAPQITPRVSNEGWYGWIPLVGPFVNRVLAKAADQFAWMQIIRRIQGADVPGYRLMGVGRAPRALEPGFAPLPIPVAEAMSLAADAKASETVGRVRDILEAAYDVQNSEVIFRRATMILSFQEVVHTSYFVNDWVKTAILVQIRTRLGGAARQPTPNEMRQIPPRLQLSPQRSAGTRHFLTLDFVRRMGFQVAPALAFAALAITWFNDQIAPRTEDYTIRQIARALSDPTKSSVGDDPSVGSVIVKLHELGSLKEPLQALLEVEDSRAKLPGLERLVTYFAARGMFSAIEDVLASDLIPEETRADRQAELLTAALRQPVSDGWQVSTDERDAANRLIDKALLAIAEFDEKSIEFIMAVIAGDRPRIAELLGRLQSLELGNLLRIACFKAKAATFREAVHEPLPACADLGPVAPPWPGLHAATAPAGPEAFKLFTPLELEKLDAAGVMKAALTFNQAMRPDGGRPRSGSERVQLRARLFSLVSEMHGLLNTVIRMDDRARMELIAQEVDRLTAKDEPNHQRARSRLAAEIASMMTREPAFANDAFLKRLAIEFSASRILASPPTDTDLKDLKLDDDSESENFIWPGIENAVGVLKATKVLGLAREELSRTLTRYRTHEDKAVATLGAMNVYNIVTYTGLADDVLKQAAIKIATDSLRFDKETYSRGDPANHFIPAALSVARAVGNVSAAPPSLRRISESAIENAERGLAFVTEAFRRVELTSKVAAKRAAQRDFRRARQLVERTNDQPEIMKTYAVILDEILKARAERRSPGPQPRHPSRQSVTLSAP